MTDSRSPGMADRPQRIVVLGGGFAGLWAAAGAVRKLDALAMTSGQVEVVLVNRDPYHSIRVRNYEADLSQVRVPLARVLDPIGVRIIEAAVTDVDVAAKRVALRTAKASDHSNEARRADGGDTHEPYLDYDRLVFALGSVLARPMIPGLIEHAFDVDTYAGAARLDAHLQSLARGLQSGSHADGTFTVAVVGGGLTGIEVATEMPQRLRAILVAHGRNDPIRVILLDRNAQVGSDMGEHARPVIEQALAAQGIEQRPNAEVAAITSQGIELRSGEAIATRTVVWTAGMRAHPLTERIPVVRDGTGRIPVDATMRVVGVPDVFAAGDAAVATLGDGAPSVMSCQHGRPMGRYAGHNVVCDLLGLPLLPLELRWYVTVLDLGEWGALYTEGRERRVAASGAQAKQTKRIINRERIYPPLSGDRAEILAAAAPTVQAPPKR